MSDFLNGFSKDNYKNGKRIVEDRHPEQGAGEDKTEYQQNSAKAAIPDNAREEIYEKDPNSDKRNRQKRLLIISGIVAGCLIIGLFIYNSRLVRLPDFVGDYAEKAHVWALQNNIFIELEEEYNMDYDRGVVISQTPSVRETIFKGGSVTMTVSKGTNPQERIPLPDFSEKSVFEIEQWIAENRADNVIINREYDDTIPQNRFIKKEFRNPDITAENYKREDRMTIIVSRGPEEFEQNIEVPDFSGKAEPEVLEWTNQTGIKLNIEHDYSDTVPENQVIKQSILPESKIAKNEELTITVSQGRAIYAPSFSGLSKEEAEVKASANNVITSIIEYYDDKIPAGRLISQSVKPGTLLNEGESTIILYYSLGSPYIPSFSGHNENDVAQMFTEMNSKKAKVSYKVDYVYDGMTPKGTVIINSNANSTVPTGSSVTLTVSKGGRVIVSDYVKKDFRSEEMGAEITKLEEQGLKVIYEYVESSRESGTIVKQSIKSGTQVNTADHILILEVAN
ncbi:PASTA domain-containing protein [Dethiobacter alkaliphilus]|uniref:PASTA domain-containing protein n=1 Tax=Dethiobacter alkaliphilus TaxID=427926 RepID=UPI00222790A1|nr:PASTA domain-containing protein [Dethiobacter alkaliphilus]MCW3488535.1 PASTA domain-containing protein [Dethiobacter alkaliphilus]